MNNIRIKLFLCFVVLLLAGCASSGVVPLSQDTFTISKKSAAGVFVNLAKLQKTVVDEANLYAEERGKVAVALDMQTVPAAPGRYPSVTYQFKLVDEASVEGKHGRKSNIVLVEQVNSGSTVPDESADSKTKFSEARYEKLFQINELRKQGILTDEEFQAEKKKILNDDGL